MTEDSKSAINRWLILLLWLIRCAQIVDNDPSLTSVDLSNHSTYQVNVSCDNAAFASLGGLRNAACLPVVKQQALWTAYA